MDKKKFLNLKNIYQNGTLSNGMKYIVSPHPLHNTCSLVFFIRVGSRNEEKNEYGLAHFLEHMLFKGNRTHKTYQSVNTKIDFLHASTNASTSKNYTNYYLKLPSRNLVPGLELLREMVFYSLLDTKELEKEKKVVIEEINKTIDDSLEYASDLLDLNIFKGHPLSHFILGSKSIISKLTKTQLMKFYQKYYCINNCCVAISGNVPSNIVKILEEVLGKEKSKPLKITFTDFISPYKKPNFVTKLRKQEQIAISMGFPAFPESDPRKYVLDALTNLLYGNMTSRLWLKLRENNPIVYGLEVDYELFEEGGYFSIDMGLSKKNLEQAFKILYRELTDLKTKLVPKKELDNIKENLIEDLLEEEDNNLHIANYYGDKFLLDIEIKTFKDLQKIYQQITASQIRKLCQELFDFQKITIVEVGDVSSSKLQKLFLQNL